MIRGGTQNVSGQLNISESAFLRKKNAKFTKL